jgi:hypothetical protein
VARPWRRRGVVAESSNPEPLGVLVDQPPCPRAATASRTGTGGRVPTRRVPGAGGSRPSGRDGRQCRGRHERDPVSSRRNDGGRRLLASRRDADRGWRRTGPAGGAVSAGGDAGLVPRHRCFDRLPEQLSRLPIPLSPGPDALRTDRLGWKADVGYARHRRPDCAQACHRTADEAIQEPDIQQIGPVTVIRPTWAVVANVPGGIGRATNWTSDEPLNLVSAVIETWKQAGVAFAGCDRVLDAHNSLSASSPRFEGFLPPSG